MLIVDSQVHIWQRPGLGPHHVQLPSFTAEDQLAAMDEAGVSAAVICPPFMMEEVNEMASAAAARHPGRLAVMGFFQIDAASAREAMRTWKDRPGMKGLRWVLNKPHQKAWWTDGTMDWVWAEAEAQGLPVSYLVNDNMAALGRAAERHPKLKLMIDHLGCVSGSKDAAAFASLPEMLALARHPNVSVKLSGAPSNSSGSYPWRNIHDPIKRIVDAFGPARCFWGTDLSRMPCSYRQCVTMFTEEMPWLKGRDLELVMGRALCDWIGWRAEEHKFPN